MSVAFPYDQQHRPPAPFVRVAVGTPSGQHFSGWVDAQVDSAAFRTVIPLDLALQTGLHPAGSIQAGGLGGHVVSLSIYPLILIIHGLQTGHSIGALASPDEQHVLLGRDVLNHYRVVLDGPNLTLEIA